MGLWQKIRGLVIREDEPGLGRDEVPDVSAVQYPKPVLEESPADESTAAQREGDGFR